MIRAFGYAIAALLVFSIQCDAAFADAIDDADKREVRVPAGDVTLAATLYRPGSATARIPVVVLGHGSAPTTRAMMTYWTNVALNTGLAVLVFDKRGTGQSTGKLKDWEVETSAELIRELAMDLVHSVRWLGKQNDVDVSRIGLMGGSQAGWTMPLAASVEPLVKFVVIGEGVPLPTGVEDAHGYYLWATRKDREGNPDVRQVLGADLMAFDYAAQKGYDPAAAIEKLSIPVLWMFGLYDTDIPARQSIDRIGQLQKAGKRNHQVHIFPYGDHNFRNVFTGERYDPASVSRAWLKANRITP